MSKCVGCGIELQNVDKSLDGYVNDLNNMLCERCFSIKNYGQYKSANKTNVDYLDIINNIRDNDVVVYVSSLLTLNVLYLDKFRNVILVLTKRDVLPKSIKDSKIIKYIKSKYDNVIDVLIVSAYKKYNLDLLYNKLCKYKKHNIYFIGITNSGKSTLINQMIESYGGGSGNITTSNYPSTTLGIVDVDIDKLHIKDTPGMIVDGSIINYLNGNDIKMINSKKEIKPVTIQVNGTGAILISNYFRIEYETDKSSMTFYMSNNLDISRISLSNPRLKNAKYGEYVIDDNKDLVIEDVGFIKITNKMKIRVYFRDNSYMYVRDKLI